MIFDYDNKMHRNDVWPLDGLVNKEKKIPFFLLKKNAFNLKIINYHANIKFENYLFANLISFY